MKRMTKLLTLIFTLMLCMACTLSVVAEFDMDKAIETTSSVQTKTVIVGDTVSVPSVAWTDISYFVSDAAVLTVEGTKLHAEKEGTAYLAIVENRTEMYVLYRYNVKEKSTESTRGNVSGGGISFDLPDLGNTGKTFSNFGKQFSFVSLALPIVFCIIFLVFVLVIASAIKSKQLDNAMHHLSTNPCEETAQYAVRKFSRINFFVRWNLSLGSDTRGVHFTYWKSVFNGKVIPSKNIEKATKEKLRAALVKLNTWDLLHVNPISAKDYARRRARELDMEEHKMHGRMEDTFDNQPWDEDDDRIAAEIFGKDGEDHVWHNLKTLATRSDCDVYRNVRIRNAGTTSEIDAVVVAENGGVFLLEIKSLGGKRGTDNYKHIAFNTLKEDPSNQIVRHQLDFIAYFKELNLTECITNVLVFSWPHNDERRIVDRETFSHMPCEVLSVEQLLNYLTTQTKHRLSAETRQAIAAKLGGISGQKSIH